MGNYNCQECVNGGAKANNELQLENNNNILSKDTSEQGIQQISGEYKVENLNKEDLGKVIENGNLSAWQKNQMNNNLNEDPQDMGRAEEHEKIRLRITRHNPEDINVDGNEENNITNEVQKKIIEYQKEQILEQQKIIEQFRKQQLLYEEQQKKLNPQIQSVQEIKIKNNEYDEQQNDGEEGEEEQDPGEEPGDGDEEGDGFINTQKMKEMNLEEYPKDAQDPQSSNKKVGYHSKKFKVETYEPVESQNENLVTIDDKNENSDLLDKMNSKSSQPRDSQRINLREPITPREGKPKEEEDINDSNKMDSVKKSPKDRIDRGDYYQNDSNRQSQKNNDIANERVSQRFTEPRDSERKRTEPDLKENNNQKNKIVFSFSKNELQIQPQNKQEEMDDEIIKKSQEINTIESNNHCMVNQTSGMESTDKKELDPPAGAVSPQQQNPAPPEEKNDIHEDSGNKKEDQNEINNAALDNNMQKLENFEHISNEIKEKTITIDPYLKEINQVKKEENDIKEKENQQKNEGEDVKQPPQNENNNAFSDNQVVNSDDKGNINNLDKQPDSNKEQNNQKEE